MFTAQTFRVQSKTQTPDGIGGFTETWADALAVNGYIDMLTGSDQNTAQNAYLEQSTHILVVPAYRSGITDKMRVIEDGGRWYAITYVDDPVGQHHHLELYLQYGGEISG